MPYEPQPCRFTIRTSKVHLSMGWARALVYDKEQLIWESVLIPIAGDKQRYIDVVHLEAKEWLNNHYPDWHKEENYAPHRTD